jgi:hypothetical protein
MDDAGRFVVTWFSYGSGESDGSSGSVQGQRFNSGGTPLGDQFQVNVYTTANQAANSVALGANGDFVVVWQSFGADSDSSSWSIQARRVIQATAVPSVSAPGLLTLVAVVLAVGGLVLRRRLRLPRPSPATR